MSSAIKPAIEFGVLTAQDIGDRETGRLLLETLCETAPELAPQKFGNWEPIRQPFRIDEALDSWRLPFLWKRSKPRSAGHVSMGRPYFLSGISITLEPTAAKLKTDRERQLVRLLTRYLDITRPAFAHIHMLVGPETERGMESLAVMPLDRKRTRFALIITVHKLRKYLPDLYWMTFFGPPYVELFGAGRLASAPAHAVSEIAGGYLIQVSERLTDLADDYDAFAARREAIIEHLGRDAFFDPEKGPDGAYRVPEFNLPERPALDPVTLIVR